MLSQYSIKYRWINFWRGVLWNYYKKKEQFSLVFRLLRVIKLLFSGTNIDIRIRELQTTTFHRKDLYNFSNFKYSPTVITENYWRKSITFSVDPLLVGTAVPTVLTSKLLGIQTAGFNDYDTSISSVLNLFLIFNINSSL